MDTHKARQAEADDCRQHQIIQEKELEVRPHSYTVTFQLFLVYLCLLPVAYVLFCSVFTIPLGTRRKGKALYSRESQSLYHN